MDAFNAIPKEKQERIIEAGYQCFGKLGYKKAATQDIAEQAGISKGMIFHYFGSKKGMYQFLIQRAYEELRNAFQTGFDPTTADFFDRILMLTNCKISCLENHPSLLSFFTSLYTESDMEVLDVTQQILEKAYSFRTDNLLNSQDIEKFIDPSYAELVFKLLMNYGEGYARTRADLQQIVAWQEEFTRCAFMLKQNLYKPEYL